MSDLLLLVTLALWLIIETLRYRAVVRDLHENRQFREEMRRRYEEVFQSMDRWMEEAGRSVESKREAASGDRRPN